jgi:hypothetical protein
MQNGSMWAFDRTPAAADTRQSSLLHSPPAAMCLHTQPDASCNPVFSRGCVVALHTSS